MSYIIPLTSSLLRGSRRLVLLLYVLPQDLQDECMFRESLRPAFLVQQVVKLVNNPERKPYFFFLLHLLSPLWCYYMPSLFRCQ